MLIAEAEAACENSYSPYSGFRVGAAVLTDEGKIFHGTNVENASYGLTVCAERLALGNTIASGHNHVRAIAVYSPAGSVSPCGACRQFILEFGRDIIVVFKHQSEIIQAQIADLLPFEFSGESLGR